MVAMGGYLLLRTEPLLASTGWAAPAALRTGQFLGNFIIGLIILMVAVYFFLVQIIGGGRQGMQFFAQLCAGLFTFYFVSGSILTGTNSVVGGGIKNPEDARTINRRARRTRCTLSASWGKSEKAITPSDTTGQGPATPSVHGWQQWPERYRDPDSAAVAEFAAANAERVYRC